MVECSLTVHKVVGSIPGRVIPKDCKNKYSFASLLNIQHLRVRSKVSGVKTRDWSSAHPYRRVVAIRKGSLRVALDLVVD